MCLLFRLIYSNNTFHVIELIVGESPLMGYYAIGPAYDFAFDQMNEAYPLLKGRIKRTRFYKNGFPSCEDGNVEALVGDVMNSARKENGHPILLSAG